MEPHNPAQSIVTADPAAIHGIVGGDGAPPVDPALLATAKLVPAPKEPQQPKVSVEVEMEQALTHLSNAGTQTEIVTSEKTGQNLWYVLNKAAPMAGDTNSVVVCRSQQAADEMLAGVKGQATELTRVLNEEWIKGTNSEKIVTVGSKHFGLVFNPGTKRPAVTVSLDRGDLQQKMTEGNDFKRILNGESLFTARPKDDGAFTPIVSKGRDLEDGTFKAYAKPLDAYQASTSTEYLTLRHSADTGIVPATFDSYDVAFSSGLKVAQMSRDEKTVVSGTSTDVISHKHNNGLDVATFQVNGEWMIAKFATEIELQVNVAQTLLKELESSIDLNQHLVDVAKGYEALSVTVKGEVFGFATGIKGDSGKELVKADIVGPFANNKELSEKAHPVATKMQAIEAEMHAYNAEEAAVKEDLVARVAGKHAELVGIREAKVAEVAASQSLIGTLTGSGPVVPPVANACGIVGTIIGNDIYYLAQTGLEKYTPGMEVAQSDFELKSVGKAARVVGYEKGGTSFTAGRLSPRPATRYNPVEVLAVAEDAKMGLISDMLQRLLDDKKDQPLAGASFESRTAFDMDAYNNLHETTRILVASNVYGLEKAPGGTLSVTTRRQLESDEGMPQTTLTGGVSVKGKLLEMLQVSQVRFMADAEAADAEAHAHQGLVFVLGPQAFGLEKTGLDGALLVEPVDNLLMQQFEAFQITSREMASAMVSDPTTTSYEGVRFSRGDEQFGLVGSITSSEYEIVSGSVQDQARFDFAVAARFFQMNKLDETDTIAFKCGDSVYGMVATPVVGFTLMSFENEAAYSESRAQGRALVDQVDAGVAAVKDKVVEYTGKTLKLLHLEGAAKSSFSAVKAGWSIASALWSEPKEDVQPEGARPMQSLDAALLVPAEPQNPARVWSDELTFPQGSQFSKNVPTGIELADQVVVVGADHVISSLASSLSPQPPPVEAVAVEKKDLSLALTASLPAPLLGGLDSLVRSPDLQLAPVPVSLSKTPEVIAQSVVKVPAEVDPSLVVPAPMKKESERDSMAPPQTATLTARDKAFTRPETKLAPSSVGHDRPQLARTDLPRARIFGRGVVAPAAHPNAMDVSASRRFGGAARGGHLTAELKTPLAQRNVQYLPPRVPSSTTVMTGTMTEVASRVAAQSPSSEFDVPEFKASDFQELTNG